MNNKQENMVVEKLKYSEIFIKNIDEIEELIKDNRREFLQFNLVASKNVISNYKSLKKIMKSNIKKLMMALSNKNKNKKKDIENDIRK